MKLLISGGHITPALSFIEYTQSVAPETDIIFAGREYSQTRLRQQSREREEIEKLHVHFIPFDAPRLIFTSIIAIFSLIILFPISIIQAIGIIIRYKPTVFVSFGSYQAVPLAIAAWCMRIPVITHEQTRSVGIANKVITFFAKKIAISFPETSGISAKHKIVLTGNLIRKRLLNTSSTKPEWLQSNSKKPLLYITGGNQGSEVINTTVGQALSRLTKKWLVIHQCGNPTAVRNYKHELEVLQSKLPSAQKFSYFVREWLHEEDLRWIYQKTHCMVSRAGANTLQELQYYAIPSVLIPLPFSRGNEQYLGAESISKNGGAYILHQRDLNPDSLVEALQAVSEQHDDMQKQLKKNAIMVDGDKKLFDLVVSVA